MKFFKITLTTLLLTSFFTFSSCTKEQGCTDPNSVNFNPDAEEDDGTCEYEGEIVFWYSEATADSLGADQATSLTYYVDDQIVGSSAANVFWTGAPDCGQNGTVTVSKNLGESSNLSYTYKVIDDTGFEYWNGVANFTANTCTTIELSW
jgi:hypothetical protein